MRVLLAAIALLSACTYEAPINDNSPALLSAISGAVVYGGTGKPAETYVTLFASDNPPPPLGTGRPLTFSAVPGDTFTQERSGLPSSSFSLTRIASGDYLLFALMDVDGDFNPFTSTLGGATCGDWGGAHINDLVSQQPAPVTVSSGRSIDDITLLVASPYTTERPAFSLLAAPLSVGALAAGTQLPLFRVQASPIAAAFSETFTLDLAPGCVPEPLAPACGDPTLGPVCPCEAATMPPCATAVWGWLVDSDGDALVDPYPAEAQAAAGLLDIWPRVYLEYTGPLDSFVHDNQEKPERWVAEAFPLAGEIGAVAAALQVPPNTAAGNLGLPIGIPTPLHEMSVTFVPLFKHYHEDGAAGEDVNGPFDVLDLTPTGTGNPATLPLGDWSVTLVSFSGQTWTLPNDLAGLPSAKPAIFPDPSLQGATLVLAP